MTSKDDMTPELAAALHYLHKHAPGAATNTYSRYFSPQQGICIIVARSPQEAVDLASFYDGIIGGHKKADGIITLRPRKN